MISMGLIFVLLLGAGVLFWHNSVTQAQEEVDQKGNAITNVCNVTFKFRAGELLANFYLKLEEVSKNNQAVSEQLNGIFEEFRKYNQTLNQYYSEVVAQVDVDFSLASNREAIAQCDIIRDNATSVAKDVMQRYLKQTAASKRDLAIVQQYDQLLKGSDRLLGEFNALKADFQTFSNRVPCIALSCVQN